MLRKVGIRKHIRLDSASNVFRNEALGPVSEMTGRRNPLDSNC